MCGESEIRERRERAYSETAIEEEDVEEREVR